MAQRGQDYALEISADGVAYTKVGKLTSASLGRQRETTDTNNFDEPDWKESISTMRSWDIDGEALYVYDDAGQVVLEAAYESNEAYFFRLTEVAQTVGAFEFTGRGFVTDASLEFSTNEVVTYSVSVEGTGPLVRAAIAA